MIWRDCEKNFDQVEWNNRSWLSSSLPTYLDFHEEDAGHLPQNFVDKDSGMPLLDEDPRFHAINRIGFWNYAVLINLVLAKRAVDLAPSEFESMLDLYDHTGRFFLRAGAAIDIAKWLADEVEQDFDTRGLFSPHPVGAQGESVHKTLKNTLKAVDAYNNAIKHNGLPAVKMVADTLEFLIPTSFTPSQRGWAEQEPKKELVEVLSDMLPKVMSAFRAYFGTLATDTAARVTRWNLKPSGTPQGIVAVKGVMSGSFTGLDGYQIVTVEDLLKQL